MPTGKIYLTTKASSTTIERADTSGSVGLESVGRLESVGTLHFDIASASKLQALTTDGRNLDAADWNCESHVRRYVRKSWVSRANDLRPSKTVLRIGVDQHINVLSATKNPYDFDCIGKRAVKYNKPSKI